MKLISIVGARPQFIKHFPVSKAINECEFINEVLVHTGQHYDYGMSKIFFDEMGIPEPDYNLTVGSGLHGKQTAEMLTKIEEILIIEKPDWVMVYGDTNSTLAGALATSKLNIPMAHIEAGLRSFNREMPEEINRVITDHIADVLFCPTENSIKNLAFEGVTKGVHLVGDVMFDALLYYISISEKYSNILKNHDLDSSEYFLVTLHRASNTDDINILQEIFSALRQLDDIKFIFPCHPRTLKIIKNNKLSLSDNIIIIEPVSYFDMLMLEKYASKILTDSGGVQKEAYLLAVPCITLRKETEWKETVKAGWNILTGANQENIIQAVREFQPSGKRPSCFGNGEASQKIVKILCDNMIY